MSSSFVRRTVNNFTIFSRRGALENTRSSAGMLNAIPFRWSAVPFSMIRAPKRTIAVLFELSMTHCSLQKDNRSIMLSIRELTENANCPSSCDNLLIKAGSFSSNNAVASHSQTFSCLNLSESNPIDRDSVVIAVLRISFFALVSSIIEIIYWKKGDILERMRMKMCVPMESTPFEAMIDR